MFLTYSSDGIKKFPVKHAFSFFLVCSTKSRYQKILRAHLAQKHRNMVTIVDEYAEDIKNEANKTHFFSWMRSVKVGNSWDHNIIYKF